MFIISTHHCFRNTNLSKHENSVRGIRNGQERGRRNGKLLFNGYRHSVFQDEKSFVDAWW